MTYGRVLAQWNCAFFDELTRWGVREIVISPGSRSTPLAMTAYELASREPERLRMYVDVDERGAAFFALGLAKASGRPVALVCTSGTAVANYYPAVVEAATSRVPLVVLTGDRPLRLQELGAPQTCDQLKMYGDYARAFRQMPEPANTDAALDFVRQAAREAVIAAVGGVNAPGPVHLNFPFDEPLKPAFEEGDFAARRVEADAPSLVAGQTLLADADRARLEALLRERRVLVLAGEGTFASADEAATVLQWAEAHALPLLADPLSGLRSFDHPCVIDNYDNVLRAEGVLEPDVVIRFGRWPVSKPACQKLAKVALQIVVDPFATRDFNSNTHMFVRMTPADFAGQRWGAHATSAAQQAYRDEWVARNAAARAFILKADAAADGVAAGDTMLDAFEGAYVHALMKEIPAGSLLFSASSMAVRAVDTFYVKPEAGAGDRALTVLCNRGQNGIDGTVSSALGAAQCFGQTTFLTGDFTMLHDLNALALQRELRLHHGAEAGEEDRSVIIVLLNNNGGAIFDILPQRSDEDYFERLFLVPQDVDFEQAAAAFKVPYCRVESVAAFAEAYRARVGQPGIHLIEVPVPLRGVRERYAPYWQA